MSLDSALASTPIRPAALSAGLPRVAAALTLLFVALVWGGILLREALPSTGPLLGQGIGSTGAAFLTPIALVVAVGLWLRATWGWWFSLIVTGYQAVSYALFLIVVLASGDATGALTWLTGLWLLLIVIVLLLPGTRRACTAYS
jgi:benzodiazapine receptor